MVASAMTAIATTLPMYHFTARLERGMQRISDGIAVLALVGALGIGWGIWVTVTYMRVLTDLLVALRDPRDDIAEVFE